MNSEPISSEGVPALPVAGATLQAVLQLSDGGMDSIAIPVPLPEVLIRVHATDLVETYFRRARSADSVVRYMEEVAALADVGAYAREAGRRHCGRCAATRTVYYVAKLSPNEPLTSATLAYCEKCYSSA